jgi:hypothetical protein
MSSAALRHVKHGPTRRATLRGRFAFWGVAALLFVRTLAARYRLRTDQRNEPCSRRATDRSGCNSQFPRTLLKFVTTFDHCVCGNVTAQSQKNHENNHRLQIENQDNENGCNSDR